MLDPYRMVFVNLILSLALLAGTLFYKFVYPKKKINLFKLLLLISILPIVSIFRAGDYESGDFNIHIYRIMSFFDSLKEGILMPSWAAELNATYGNPLFIFNYSLPYYAISFFHLIGLSFIFSTKLYLGLVLYFSGIFMYLFIKELTQKNEAAFAAAIFYVFSPYHLVDIHFRATLGESTVFLIIPLLFLFVTKYLKSQKIVFLLLCSLTTFLMVIAHPLLSIAACALLGLYVFFYGFINKSIKSAVFILTFVIIGALASSYAWIPFIIYSQYTFPNPNPNLIFYPFLELFYSPFRYGFLFQGPNGELALIIGYTQIFVTVILFILLLINKLSKKIKNYFIFWFLSVILLLFLMSPLSRLIWEHFPIFWMYLPFGRLQLITAFCTSVIAAYFALTFSSSSRKKILYFVLIATIGYTVLNWGHRRVIPEINDNILRKNVWISTVNEGITAHFLNNKWADINNFWFTQKPKNHLLILNGKGSVKEVYRNSVKHSYVVSADTPLKIQENTLYFPGWTLKINGEKETIYPGKRGVINANLPKGILNVEFHYEDLLLYKVSKKMGISFLFVLIVLIATITLRSKFNVITSLSRKPKHLSGKI